MSLNLSPEDIAAAQFQAFPQPPTDAVDIATILDLLKALHLKYVYNSPQQISGLHCPKCSTCSVQIVSLANVPRWFCEHCKCQKKEKTNDVIALVGKLAGMTRARVLAKLQAMLSRQKKPVVFTGGPNGTIERN